MAWEEQLFPFIDSCSIACGGHFGDEASMAKTLKIAIWNGVNPGAHPSYPDIENFGRRSMKLSEDQFKTSLRNQLDRYFTVLDKFQIKNHHIKAHGALYNDLLMDKKLSTWFLEVVQLYNYGSIYTLFNGVLAQLAKEYKAEVVFEAFIDRNYDRTGKLVSRALSGALKQDASDVWEQLLELLEFQQVKTIEGTIIPMKANTYCIHGDHPGSVKNVCFIRKNLIEMGR